MTSDEEKDPPVPSYLENIALKRVHEGRVAEDEQDADNTEPSPSIEPDK